MPENAKDGTEIGSLKRVVGERKGIDLAHDVEAAADPELVERARRRRFSAEYKLRVLREADGCVKPGEVGALLRREGLYSSLLTEWRRQRERGSLAALDRTRGRPKVDPRDAQLAALRRRAERAEAKLEKARRVIEVQGNVSALLGGRKPTAPTSEIGLELRLHANGAREVRRAAATSTPEQVASGETPADAAQRA